MRFPDAGGTKVIYFDNAATTLQKPETVAKAVAEAISNLGNAGRGAMMPLYIVCEWLMKPER